MGKNSVVALAILMGAAMLAPPNARSQDGQTAQQLPRAAEIPGVKPEVLAKAEIPGVPGRLLIVSRTTYQPGARLRKHYHTSEITFYVLEGTMVFQDEGKEPVTLKAGDFRLVKPGTIHNALEREHDSPARLSRTRHRRSRPAQRRVHGVEESSRQPIHVRMAWPHACCGVVNNGCCELSCATETTFKPSAAPLPPPKPAIAWTS